MSDRDWELELWSFLWKECTKTHKVMMMSNRTAAVTPTDMPITTAVLGGVSRSEVVGDGLGVVVGGSGGNDVVGNDVAVSSVAVGSGGGTNR